MSERPANGIGGIHHLTAVSGDARRAVDFYTSALGLRLIKQTANFDDPSSYHLYFADEEHGPGALTFFEWKEKPKGRFGIGGTHHLAFETSDRDRLRQWKRRLTDLGIAVTGPYDRVYFQSIYFRDPDGHLVEIATDTPGFAIDEPREELGRRLTLPPWLEPRRAEIEQRLTPLAVPEPARR